MKSILNALFDNELSPGARRYAETTESVRAAEEYRALVKTWRESHSEREYEGLEEIISANNAWGYYSNRGAFVQGFQLGSLFLLEVLESRNRF